jgi:mono/diheme cytochrome c family protein
MIKTVRIATATIAVLAILAIAGGAAFIKLGIYNVAATQQHLGATYWLLDTALMRSIEARARDITAPDLSDPAMIRSGLADYQAHCVQCHGAPGVPPQPFAMGMTPVPPNLLPAAREWQAEEIFWTIKYGIKMSGMPAWTFRMTDDEIWAVTAFTMRLPLLSPADYRAFAGRADTVEAGPEP